MNSVAFLYFILKKYQFSTQNVPNLCFFCTCLHSASLGGTMPAWWQSNSEQVHQASACRLRTPAILFPDLEQQTTRLVDSRCLPGCNFSNFPRKANIQLIKVMPH